MSPNTPVVIKKYIAHAVTSIVYQLYNPIRGGAREGGHEGATSPRWGTLAPRRRKINNPSGKELAEI